jgi:hypothetical protein
MIKIKSLVELPIVCGALSQSPKVPLRAFLSYPFKKLVGRLPKRWKKDSPSPFLIASGGGQKS